MEILDADALAFLWNAQSSWQIFDVFDVELSATTGIDPWPHPRQLPPAARQHEIPVNFQWWLWQAPEDWWKLGWYLAFPASLSSTEFAADHYWRLRLNGSMNFSWQVQPLQSQIQHHFLLDSGPSIGHLWTIIIHDPRSIWRLGCALSALQNLATEPSCATILLNRWTVLGPSSGASILRRTSIILSFFRSWRIKRIKGSIQLDPAISHDMQHLASCKPTG